jgi:three-Cys-motif partner protein
LDCKLEGSPVRAVKSRAKFTHFSFLTPNRATSERIKASIGDENFPDNIQIVHGNPNNEKSLQKALNFIPRSASSLVLIDPGGYRKFNWSTLENMVAHGKNWQGEKMELLFIFPLEMALLRNLMRPECEQSVTRFYGNQQWEEIKRLKKVSKTDSLDIKRKLVELFKDGLRNLGYRYVEDFKPASPTHDPYYHLIFAGDNASRLRNLKEAWGKSRFLRCELLYGVKTK